MKFLLDSHFLIWIAGYPRDLPPKAQTLLEDSNHEIFFSAASIWEISIKHALGKPHFEVDPRVLRRRLLASGYRELQLMSEHAIGVIALPPIHKDPFDRILVAQATVEGITLLTSDKMIGRYPGPIQRL